MQTERQFRVEKYLEIARLTTDASSREEFLEMARHTLELDESEFSNASRYVEMSGYFGTVTSDDFIKRPVTETYRAYASYCQENGESILSRQKFNKCAEQALGLTRIKGRSGIGTDRRNTSRWAR